MNYNKYHTRIEVTRGECVHAFIITGLDPVNQNKPVIIFSHGFSVDGVESYRLFHSLAHDLSNDGFTCVLFDYRGSGYSDLNFDRMTIDTEIADLHAVTEAVEQRHKPSRIVYFGMSFGCAVAALTAAERHNISGLLLWSTSSRLFERYRARLGEQIFTDGYTFTDKGFKVDLSFLQSLLGKDVPGAIAACSIPALLIHGDADQTADIALAREIKTVAPKAELIEMHGGNHGFKLQPELLQQAARASRAWLQKVTGV